VRKRSSYRPRVVRYDNMAHVRAGLEPMTADAGQFYLLMIKSHDALDLLVHGTATRAQMELLTNICNITSALAKQGYGANWLPEIHAGEEALFALSRRGMSNDQHFVGTDYELNAVRDLIDVHDAQLEVITIQEMERAMDYVIEAERNKLARCI
jgi:hypothetical protein